MTFLAPIFAWWLAMFGVTSPEDCADTLAAPMVCEQAPPPPHANRKSSSSPSFSLQRRGVSEISNGF